MPLLRTFLSSETSIALSTYCLSLKGTPIRNVPPSWAAHGRMYVKRKREDYSKCRNPPLKALPPDPRSQINCT
jgi:hypothetical protein